MGAFWVNPRFFHVYQDTPSGREALAQTAFFCQILGAAPLVYIPESPSFLMYFENRVVQVDLGGKDWSPAARELSRLRAEEILRDAGLDARFLDVRHRTTPSLPDIPIDFDCMACPVLAHAGSWVYSDLGMRRLPSVAPFPVFIPAPVAKPWKSILLCYGGEGSNDALCLSLALAEAMDFPLDIFGLGGAEVLNGDLEKAAGLDVVDIRHRLWQKKTAGNPWMAIPADALVVLGASGKSWIRERFFPSFKKKARYFLPFPMLFVGPKATASKADGGLTSLHG